MVVCVRDGGSATECRREENLWVAALRGHGTSVNLSPGVRVEKGYR